MWRRALSSPSLKPPGTGTPCSFVTVAVDCFVVVVVVVAAAVTVTVAGPASLLVTHLLLFFGYLFD